MQYKHAYLLLYNVTLLCGWLTYFIVFAVQSLTTRSIEHTFDKCVTLLQVVQYVPVVEVVHSVLKIINAPVVTTFIQVFSRVMVVAVLSAFKHSAVSIGYVMISVAWSIAETVRYVYYVVNVVDKGKMWYWLVWCRYSLFIVLYPVGVSGELITLWRSMEELKKVNVMNGVRLSDCVMVVIVGYVPGLVMLYLHLLKQRGKVLGKVGDKKKE